MARIQDRWEEFVRLLGCQAGPEYRHCFPNSLLDAICSAAQDGMTAMGCRIASPACCDEIYTVLNQAWIEFWRDPAGYGAWEQQAVTALFAPKVVG